MSKPKSNVPKTRISHLARNAKRLLAFLEEKRGKISPLLILTHDYPDPDALASAVALEHMAEQCYGIQCRIAYGGVIGRTENKEMVQILRLPVHKLKHSDFKKYKHTVLVDTQPMFENNPFPLSRKPTIVIDQHPFVKRPNAELAIIDTECGATSAILAKALLMLKRDIPTRVATALAYGILSDTLNLYRAPHAQVIDTYLDLLPFCDMRALARIQHPSRSKRFFISLARGIHHARVRKGLIVSHLGLVENPDLVSQIAEFMLAYKGAKYSCCTGRYKGKLHVSLRVDKPALEAGKILRDIFASRGEAGGHGAIGGGSFYIGEDIDEEIWKEMEATFGDSLAKRLRLPKKSEFINPFRLKPEEK